MNILFLSPQPLYQDRGSPIAVDMLLRELSNRGDHVDVVTYHEGRDIHYDNVTLHRIPNIPVRNLPPGFSWKKIICDIFMFYLILVVFFKNRKRYQVIHAVEEAVFFALFLKIFFGTSYIYDMDSSLAQQMQEQLPFLKPLAPIFRFFEGLAIRHAIAVIPVCQALAKDVAKHTPRKVVILNDVSMLKNNHTQEKENLKAALGIDSPMLMYVGNLQPYQGIDLLIESFAVALNQVPNLELVIIGGTAADIEQYQHKAHSMGIESRVHFVGPRPIERLADYLAQADVLVSPRIMGRNTPMKIYSYLHSGKALLATNICSHTQILTDQVAWLAEPAPESYARGMVALTSQPALRHDLGKAGRTLIEQDYTLESFQRKLNHLYDWLNCELGQPKALPTSIRHESFYASTKKLR